MLQDINLCNRVGVRIIGYQIRKGGQAISEMSAARTQWRSRYTKDTKVTARRRLWGTPHEGFVRGLSGGIKAGWY